MFSSHTYSLQPPLYAQVCQLANGFFSSIMHCKAPLAQVLFFKENNGVFCSQRYNFLLALPIKKNPVSKFLLCSFQT